MKTSFIKTDIKENIFTLTLNRPEASNAYTVEMVEDLCLALKNAERNNDVKVIVITGEGKHFCAGGDIKTMKNKTGMFAGDGVNLQKLYEYGIQEIPLTMESISKPIIAAVNGAAVGAGLDLACMCDLRYASESARFGETFAKLALVPGDGGAFFLSRVVGYSKAMELTLTARIFQATEALNIGLVSAIFSSEELLKEVYKVAQNLTTLPVHTLRYAKKILKQTENKNLKTHLDFVSAFQVITQQSDDHEKSLR